MATTSNGVPLIVLEVVLGFLVPVAWGVWQLVELRRLDRRDAERRAARDAAPADEDPAAVDSGRVARPATGTDPPRRD